MISFLLSALSRRFHGAGVEALTSAYDCCWLVWEPGAWKPPGVGSPTLLAVRVPTPVPSAGAGEALALAMIPRKAGSGQLTLGRGPANDLEINDATLSQVHLLLMEASRHCWTVRDAGSRNGTWADDRPLAAGGPRMLASGMRIQAGQVCLTYYDPHGLLERLSSFSKAATPVPATAAPPRH